MAVWFRTRKYSIEIDAVEITRETPKKLHYLQEAFDGKKVERVTLKNSSYDNFFPTFEGARAYLLDLLKRELEYHSREAHAAELKIAKVTDLTA